MITLGNLKDLLLHLEFTSPNGTVYTRQFPNVDASLSVDFANEQLMYPENKGLKINERQTCNFHSNENFVVFECVCRLLAKGYKPEHLELEPKWKVGHGASGGRADILVKDNSGKALLIVECKTAGRELADAWNDTRNHGGQLLSYVQQQRSTQFVCLYASDWDGRQVSYENYLIALKDNQQRIEELKDQEPLTYADAQEATEIYKVWRDTYALDFATKGVFEDDIQAYQIGKQKFTVADLRTVSHRDIQSKYHEFATILRQHNVSGRENAFDKLVNLFLCKIVDEKTHANDLRFYWKGIAYDSHFDLQDRLQQLYQAGMKTFLGEDVTYVKDEQIDQAFRYFRNDPDATRDTIKKYFRQLKFFTNNDFAFIDVHNEKLFYQNAAVLLKMVRMLQDIRLQSGEQNQFLGDLFEGFLDSGVKQSEGQFFTPTPITKFILMSLPLQQLVRDSPQPPRVIDYACGAGHFLNELATQIKPFVEAEKKAELKDYHGAIYGIEKEYRLSKVAKVSAFMYEQDDIHIVYADALAAHPQIEDGTFSVLVANPPFSVKGFLETLPDADRQRYSLSQTIDAKSLAKNNSIETFFIERAKQLLRPGGVAGVIVPSSILSNAKAAYVRTREILLQYFDLVAVAQFGSRTFGKTGTNTVTLFLRRKAEDPAPADHFRNRVNAWFKAPDDHQGVFADEAILRRYCAHVEVPFDDYQTLLRGSPSAALLAHERFRDYRRDFDNSTEIKQLKKSKGFRALYADAQEEALNVRFLTYLRRIEKDKLYYYALADTAPQPVVLVKSPTDNAAQKQFLGYDWSGAKGNEGIKYLTGGPLPKEKADDGDESEADEETRVLENLSNLSRIQTPLYDPAERLNPEKLNFYIHQAFLGEPVTVPEALAPFLSTARLVDMLDFSRVGFDKQFSLTPKRSVAIDTVWELVRLGDYVEVISGLWKGETPPFKLVNVIRNTNFGKAGALDLSNVAQLEVEEKQYEKRKLQAGDIIIEKSGGSETQAVGRVVLFDLNDGEYSFSNFTSRIRLISDEFNASYLFLYLNYFYDLGHTFHFQNGTSGLKNLDFNRYLSIKIPLPPEEIQSKIVAECEAVNEEVADAGKIAQEAEKQIREQTERIFSENAQTRLSDLVFINKNSYDPTNKPDDDFIYVDIESVGKGDGSIKFSQKVKGVNAPSRARRLAFRSNVLISTVRPNLKGFAYLDKEPINCVFSTGFAVLESQNENILLNKFIYYAFMYSNNLMQQMEATMGKAAYPSITKSDIENFKIPVPPLPEQAALVAAVEALEARIAEATAVLDGAAARKQAILKKYLTELPEGYAALSVEVPVTTEDEPVQWFKPAR